MANGSLDIKERLFHSVVDEMGIDPLRDSSWDAIQTITQYTEHVVTQDEERNTPLIAFEYYGDVKYWWIIQVYNGLPDMFGVKTGTRLKLPNASLVLSALARLGATAAATPPTVSI